MASVDFPALPPTPVLEKEAILMVDDERPLLDVFVNTLSPWYDCHVATSAREAEQLLRARSFRVILSDHLMPGGNGMSLLVRVRDEFPHMQRVLVTGFMKPEMLLRSVNEAALFRYLLKPVSMGELIKTVQEAIKAPVVRTRG